MGIELIAEERGRQLMPKSSGGEGWTHEHDAKHKEGELAAAAGVYALLAASHEFHFKDDEGNEIGLATYWPLEWEGWFKPKDKLRNLVRAGALIVAEIDRLQRETERQNLNAAAEEEQP